MWSASDIPSQNGRVAVVTGTGGLGYETALALAHAGAEVILAGRNSAKGEASVARVQMCAPNSLVRFEQLDLGSLSSIEAFAKRLAGRLGRIDLLINNAGVMMPPARLSTVDQFELQFGTNHLGHFALTAHLLPLLRRARTPRVVSVTSQACRNGTLDFDDLQAERNYNAFRAYAQSKLAQLVFSVELQRRSDRAGWTLRSTAAHPGWAKTDLFQNGPGKRSFSNLLNRFVAEPLFAQSAAEGALPTLYAAIAEEAVGGALYGPSGWFEMRGAPQRSKMVASALRLDSAQQLWNISERLTRVSFPLVA